MDNFEIINSSYKSIVEWPITKDKPEHVLLGLAVRYAEECLKGLGIKILSAKIDVDFKKILKKRNLIYILKL